MAGIDSLRLAAAGLVLVQHVADRMTGPGWHMIAALSPGVAGVVLFFLISGFVIPFSVARGFDPASFAIRRITRIFPLYYAALASVVALTVGGVVSQWAWLGTLSPVGWAANLLLVQDFTGQRAVLGVSWTLIIELAWYTLFAVSVLLFRARALPVLSWAMPLAIAALGLASLVLDLRIPLARPGMLYAAVLGYQLHAWFAGELSRRAMRTSLGLFCTVMGGAILLSFGHFAHARIGLFQALVPWLTVPLLFALIIARPGVLAHRWTSRGVLPALGATSYSIYLLHPIALAATFQYLSPAVAAVSGVLLTLVLAAIGYRWVELPGIALGQRLARRTMVRVLT